MGRKYFPVSVDGAICRDLKTAARHYGFRYIFAFRRLREARRLGPVTIDGFTLQELEPAPDLEPEHIPAKPRASGTASPSQREPPPKRAPTPAGPVLEDMIQNCPGWARGWGPILRPLAPDVIFHTAKVKKAPQRPASRVLGHFRSGQGLPVISDCTLSFGVLRRRGRGAAASNFFSGCSPSQNREGQIAGGALQVILQGIAAAATVRGATILLRVILGFPSGYSEGGAGARGFSRGFLRVSPGCSRRSSARPP